MSTVRVLRTTLTSAGVLMLCALAACSSTAPRTQPGAAKMASGTVLLLQVRAAGQLGVELDVQPLRDPQVEDLRAVAKAAEGRGDFAGAQRAISQALEITPDEPGLLQWQAELALVSHDFAGAEELATRSWKRGPKLGGLCRRNWTTRRFAAEARGDAAVAAQARQQADACAVAPPNRY